MVMINLNVTKFDDIGNALNMDEDRKKTVLEYIDSPYIDINVKLRVIIHEIFEDIIEKGMSPRDIQLLMEDNDIISQIEKEFDNWDINIVTM